MQGWKPDWHQYMAFQVLSRERPFLVRCSWMASSLFLIGILTFTSVGILQGIDESSCIYASDCFSGYWCSATEGHCEQCFDTYTEKCPVPSDAAFLAVQPARLRVSHHTTVSYLHRASDEVRSEKPVFGISEGLPKDWSWGDKEFGNMCKGCYSDNKGAFVSNIEIGKLHIQAMRRSDWAATAVATVVVLLSVLKELRDTQLLELTWQEKGSGLGVGWNVAIWILSSLRHFAFLPAIVCTVPTLIIVTGGNALRVCMDTVALLFVLELDILMVHLALDEEELPSLYQQVAVALKKRNPHWSHWAEWVHILVLFIAVFYQLRLPLWSDTFDDYTLGLFATPLAFLFTSLFSVVVMPPAGSRCGAFASVFAKWFVGMAWFVLMIAVSNQNRAELLGRIFDKIALSHLRL